MNALAAPRRASGLNLIRRLILQRIGGKIVVPYVVLVLVLGIIGLVAVTNLVATSITEKFHEDLANGGRAANEAMLKVEDRQLATARQMAFTVGVADAMARRDIPTLQVLLGPLQVNQRVGYVDVFLPDGQQIFALRPQDRQADAAGMVDPNAATWPPVHKVLNGTIDNLGDKFSGLVQTAWGDDLLVTAAPVRRGEELAGVIAIGQPLQDVVGDLSQEAVMGVTLYQPDGSLRATTVTRMATGANVPPDDTAALLTGGTVMTRQLEVGGDRVVEMLGTLTLRNQPAAILSVSLPVNLIQDTGTRTRNIFVALGTAIVTLVLLIGFALARHLTRPIDVLVDATERVKSGDLEFIVPVLTQDETGLLAGEFNSMLGGLRERNRTRDAFGRYFSDEFYAMVQNGQLELGGEVRDITVIMSDIRSFTTLSEGLEPSELVTLLNEYFEGQVAAIKRHGGEVDKFMGDAILAKFGAPRWYPDHARRAVLAMLDMRKALAEFNRRRAERGQDAIRIGIGGNTGPLVVGNIGSSERMEYTIIGDTVNATQRIEDLTKDLHWDLLISDATYEHVKDLVVVGEPHRLVLRGRSQESLIYPLLTLQSEAAPDAAFPAAFIAAPVAAMHLNDGVSPEVDRSALARLAGGD